MKFKPLSEVLGCRMWGTRSGRHSYVITYLPEIGYCVTWNDATQTPTRGAKIIGENLKTWAEAESAARNHAREHHLK